MNATWSRELHQKARAENFPVALRILPAGPRRHLEALYRFARSVDDLGDEWQGDREAALTAVADDVRRLYDGRRPALPLVQGIEDLVHTCGVPPEPWLRLVEAGLRDQRVTRYESVDDLREYCTFSADPVGEVVLAVFGQSSPDRVALSDRICSGLQLVEHLQDIGEDYRAGRVYLPQEDLRAFGVEEQDLGGARATAELSALVRFEADRAAAWFDAGAPILRDLTGWARLAVTGYLAGGRATLAALRRCGYDPLARAARPTRAELLGAALSDWGGRAR